MNKMRSDLRTLGAAILCAAAFVACSSDDNVIGEQPTNPTEPQVYTMTIQASKSTGDDSQTRGLSWNNPNTYDKIKVNWHEGEEVRVVQNGSVVGTLTSKESNNGETTLSGTLTSVTQDADLQFFLHADENCKMDYTGQKGGVVKTNDDDGNIEYNYDFAEAKLTKIQFRLDTKTGTITNMDNSVLNFTSNQAIVRFELFNKDGSANVYAKKLIISDANTGKIVKSIDGLTGEKTYGPLTYSPYAVTTGGQSCIFTMALNVGADAYIVLDAIDNEGKVYAHTQNHVTFTPGKYYKVKVNMTERTQKFINEITPEDTYLKGWYVDKYAKVTKTYDASNCYAVVAYVGKVPGYFDNFLAMAMHDSKKDGSEGSQGMTWSEALAATGSYATAHPIVIGTTTYNTSSHGSSAYDRVEYHVKINNTDPEPDTYPTNTATGAARQGWRLPTVTDWRYVFEGLCGSPSATVPVGITQDRGPYADNNATLYSTLNSKAGNMVESGYYWTGSEYDTMAWYFSFNQGSSAVKGFFYSDKGNSCYVRPVFAY